MTPFPKLMDNLTIDEQENSVGYTLVYTVTLLRYEMKSRNREPDLPSLLRGVPNAQKSA